MNSNVKKIAENCYSSFFTMICGMLMFLIPVIVDLVLKILAKYDHESIWSIATLAVILVICSFMHIIYKKSWKAEGIKITPKMKKLERRWMGFESVGFVTLIVIGANHKVTDLYEKWLVFSEKNHYGLTILKLSGLLIFVFSLGYYVSTKKFIKKLKVEAKKKQIGNNATIAALETKECNEITEVSLPEKEIVPIETTVECQNEKIVVEMVESVDW